MGKSSKKSAPKVDAAPPVSVTPSKPMKKGKREAEELLEKELVNVKKQKKGVVEDVIEKKTEAKKAESSSSDDSSDSEIEEQSKAIATKPLENPKKPQLSATKNGAAKKVKPASSSDDSDTSSDDSDSDVAPSKPAAAAKNGSKAVRKKESDLSESESDSDDSSSDDARKLPAPAKNGPVTANKKKDEDERDTSEDESSSSEDEKAPAKGTKSGTQAAVKKTADSSEDESSSDEEDVPSSGTAKGALAAKKKDESSDDETSDSDEEPPAKVPAKRPSSATESKKAEEESSEDSSEEESEEEEPQKKKTKVVPKTEKKESSSEEESSDESSDDEPSKKTVVKKVAQESSSEETSSEDEEESSDEEERSKTPQKKDADVDMVDAFSKKGPSSEKKEPKTPAAQPQASGSKTLFLGNLSYSVQKSDVEDFFKDFGEVVDVRFAAHPDGAFKGFGHVEFATAEAAQKALSEMNGKELLGRGLRLDIAAERGSYTPQSGKERNSFQKGFGSQGKATAYVRGFDTSAEENEIKGALRAHFESCGEITRISLPRGDDGFKGIAYIDFASRDSLEKAIEFDNHPLNDYPLTVQEAKPRDNAGFGGRFGNSNDRGGRFGSGGWFGSGRSDRGGRNGGSRGRGRGNFNKPSMATAGTGKKTTFGDD